MMASGSIEGRKEGSLKNNDNNNNIGINSFI
jgi:hypothetical protein